MLKENEFEFGVDLLVVCGVVFGERHVLVGFSSRVFACLPVWSVLCIDLLLICRFLPWRFLYHFVGSTMPRQPRLRRGRRHKGRQIVIKILDNFARLTERLAKSRVFCTLPRKLRFYQYNFHCWSRQDRCGSYCWDTSFLSSGRQWRNILVVANMVPLAAA